MPVHIVRFIARTYNWLPSLNFFVGLKPILHSRNPSCAICPSNSLSTPVLSLKECIRWGRAGVHVFQSSACSIDQGAGGKVIIGKVIKTPSSVLCPRPGCLSARSLIEPGTGPHYSSAHLFIGPSPHCEAGVAPCKEGCAEQVIMITLCMHRVLFWL